MGIIINKLSAGILTVTKCKCFAHDNCFKHIRNSLEKIGVEWEEELLDNRGEENTINIRIFSKMDRAFFHPDRFEILIDARGFRPEEIKCTVTAKTVEVSAQKENQMDNSQKRMSLLRQYLLPQNAIPERGQCCLSSDGMLLVTAPWMK